jgi:type VI secretion system protein ImpE
MTTALNLTTDPDNDLARSRLRAGDVQGALDALRERLRREPTVAALRIFYFQLLIVTGDWDRAEQQLDTLKTFGTEHLPFVSVYRDALKAERERLSILATGGIPHLLGEPLPWMAPLIEAARQLAQGNFSAAAALRDEAFDQAPALAGHVQTDAGEFPFDWIADADTRFGPVLEVIHRDRYAWLPWQHVRRIDIPSPSDLRDFVWTPVELNLTNGTSLPTLIPSRYVGSESAIAALQLARQTEWQELPEGHWIGLGQKEFATDVDQYPLLGLRSMVLTQPEPGDAADHTVET